MKICFKSSIISLAFFSLTACASPTQQPLTVRTVVASPAPTRTPVANQPIATSTRPVSTATNETPGPTATPEFPPIPPGQGALIIINNNGQDMNYEISGKLYRVPGNGKTVIFLPPGTYNFSATIPGFSGISNTLEIQEGLYLSQSWAS